MYPPPQITTTKQQQRERGGGGGGGGGGAEGVGRERGLSITEVYNCTSHKKVFFKQQLTMWGEDPGVTSVHSCGRSSTVSATHNTVQIWNGHSHPIPKNTWQWKGIAMHYFPVIAANAALAPTGNREQIIVTNVIISVCLSKCHNTPGTTSVSHRRAGWKHDDWRK